MTSETISEVTSLHTHFKIKIASKPNLWPKCYWNLLPVGSFNTALSKAIWSNWTKLP